MKLPDKDQELILLSKLKNPDLLNQGFNELMEVYQKPLYAHLFKMLNNYDDADEALQNTFIKVYQHVHAFRHESKLFSWLYKIAHREALYLLSSRKRRNYSPIDEIDSEIFGTSSQSILNANQIQRKLEQAIEALPEKQKQVFQMKYYEQLKYEEISEILGTSVGALKASYHHALKKITLLLDPD